MSPYRESAAREPEPDAPPPSSSSSLIAILLVMFVIGIGLVVTRNADRAVARLVTGSAGR